MSHVQSSREIFVNFSHSLVVCERHSDGISVKNEQNMQKKLQKLLSCGAFFSIMAPKNEREREREFEFLIA
jgi:hypothetical protein